MRLLTDSKFVVDGYIDDKNYIFSYKMLKLVWTQPAIGMVENINDNLKSTVFHRLIHRFMGCMNLPDEYTDTDYLRLLCERYLTSRDQRYLVSNFDHIDQTYSHIHGLKRTFKVKSDLSDCDKIIYHVRDNDVIMCISSMFFYILDESMNSLPNDHEFPYVSPGQRHLLDQVSRITGYPFRCVKNGLFICRKLSIISRYSILTKYLYPVFTWMDQIDLSRFPPSLLNSCKCILGKSPFRLWITCAQLLLKPLNPNNYKYNINYDDFLHIINDPLIIVFSVLSLSVSEHYLPDISNEPTPIEINIHDE